MQRAAFWIAAGLVLVLVPGDFDAGGMVRGVLIVLGITLVLTPPAVYYAIMRQLPENVGIREIGRERVPDEVERLAARYEHGGFRRVLQPMTFDLPNETIMVALQDESGAIGTIYKIGGERGRVAYDVVSILAGDAVLTTAQDHGAGVLPAAEGTLRQIIEGARPEDLIRHHRSTVEELDRLGIPAIPVAPTAIPGLLRRSFRVNRAQMEKAPVKHTLVALWRTITKKNKHIGMLADQAGILDQLARLRARARHGTPAARRRVPVEA